MSNIVSTPKPEKGLTEHVATLDGIFKGVRLVRLDMHILDEERYRLHIPGGAETRITVSQKRHCQETRRHRDNGVYQMHRGWCARVTERSGELVVDMAFAHNENFVLITPKDVDYVLVLSPATFTYLTGDTKPSTPVRDALYERAKALTDEEIIRLYAKQASISYFDIQRAIARSFEPIAA